ncbi:hypothetical protein GFS60_07108 (plasmid) [Rhodococcus sp. WAY2]|nr:hypothetical protein GFS60_07108 [Rhodococcus sp. WAY2]
MSSGATSRLRSSCSAHLSRCGSSLSDFRSGWASARDRCAAPLRLVDALGPGSGGVARRSGVGSAGGEGMRTTG